MVRIVWAAAFLSGAIPGRAEARVFRDDRPRMGSPMSIQIDAPAESEAAARRATEAAYKEVDRLVRSSPNGSRTARSHE